MPAAYGLPITELWLLGERRPHSIIQPILLLFGGSFWSFGVILIVVSVAVPIMKLVILSWFLLSVHRHSASRLTGKTRLYRFIDRAGRWSNLDPFTIMIYAPKVQFAQLAHVTIRIGASIFLVTVLLAMVAAHVFDPCLMWDAARAGAEGGDAVSGAA